MSVTMIRDGLTGFVTLDNPSVNAIGRAMREGLMDAVAWAETEMLDRVIVTGAGRAFAAGADAKEFDGAALEPYLPDVLDAIERSFVPWIAAINGVALGGGAEIALACRMRIMGPRAQIGLPEVTLGVIPGAGGTQRAMRLCGLDTALEMIAYGKPLGAKAALATGLVHAVEEDPVDAADMVNSEELLCIVPTWELPAPDMNADAFAKIREGLAKRSKGQVAPLKAVEVIEAGLSMEFADAMALERAAFLELKAGDQSRALRHMFFSERAAKAPNDLPKAPEISKIAIVGGGTMGAGIAYACLSVGLPVVLLETDADAIARAQHNIDTLIGAGLKRGRLDDSGAAALRDRLTLTEDYAAASDATLVIEAAFESMDVKKDIFAKLDAAVSPDTVLATNTSYLDVDVLAASTRDPSRILGLHFFAPAHIMRLLEIVTGAETSDRALATGYALAKLLKKVPVLAGVCDGFIGNRIFSRYKEEADILLMDGAVPWEVDDAMEAFGYAMGPFEVGDLSGLDIGFANRRRQDATRDPNRRYIPIADRMVNEGRLGRKASVGWYRYPGGGGKVIDPLIEDLIAEEAHFAGATRTEIADEVVVERLLLAMINEAADILGEGIARSAADIDLVTVFGYGFPRWRGGLMHYADTRGVAQIVEKLRSLEAVDPVIWKVSPVLLDCAQTGTKLADWQRTT
ncbi:3-hydroxyacyl-CoA dehydrogenase NAD-binding domain-containing protein [Jannaschia sp. CCS1]|uniref:3-hydroxyacyl-CoA dehydrogenase NAD-binding domain-containing protein n=1 Tax=Jannaschia sp. (strain CCS1) TaxID=290400 RepID=UPI000053BFFC|nr:3-hydroxyacyl-CoA dehydrogenase NAD-binding domain-containing protein [Jannaschia sp. CCS1]ABD53593.1 3-hydroxyacyl-CoA dehydrogenase [Jannaschia sp. CCS1]